MRVRLRGVYKSEKKARDGSKRTYWFLRSVGAINPLPGDEDAPFWPGQPAFMRAYNAVIDAPRQARVLGTLQSVTDR